MVEEEEEQEEAGGAVLRGIKRRVLDIQTYGKVSVTCRASPREPGCKHAASVLHADLLLLFVCR